MLCVVLLCFCVFFILLNVVVVVRIGCPRYHPSPFGKSLATFSVSGWIQTGVPPPVVQDVILPLLHSRVKKLVDRLPSPRTWSAAHTFTVLGVVAYVCVMLVAVATSAYAFLMPAPASPLPPNGSEQPALRTPDSAWHTALYPTLCAFAVANAAVAAVSHVVVPGPHSDSARMSAPVPAWVTSSCNMASILASVACCALSIVYLDGGLFGNVAACSVLVLWRTQTDKRSPYIVFVLAVTAVFLADAAAHLLSGLLFVIGANHVHTHSRLDHLSVFLAPSWTAPTVNITLALLPLLPLAACLTYLWHMSQLSVTVMLYRMPVLLLSVAVADVPSVQLLAVFVACVGGLALVRSERDRHRALKVL